jgi:hypothetical protein
VTELTKQEIKDIVIAAMEYHWNDFVCDTNSLPDDIELSNSRTKASFSPGQWADNVGESVAEQVMKKS